MGNVDPMRTIVKQAVKKDTDVVGNTAQQLMQRARLRAIWIISVGEISVVMGNVGTATNAVPEVNTVEPRTIIVE